MDTRNLSKSKIIKSLAIFGLIFFSVLALFSHYALNDLSRNQKAKESIIENFTLSQMVSAVGEPVKWIKIIHTTSVDNVKHFLEIPSVATNVKVSVLPKNKVVINKTSPSPIVTDKQKLSEFSNEVSQSEASLALAKSIKNRPGFFANFFNTFSRILSSMFAAVEMGTSTETVLIDLTASSSPIVDEIAITPEVTEVVPTEESITTETITVEESTSTTESVVIEPSTSTQEESIVSNEASSSTEENSTTTEESITIESISSEALATLQDELPNYFISTSTEVSTTTEATSTEQTPSDVVVVQYETPAPIIAEAETDTGKVVSVSAPEGEVPVTNVVAFTNIPEIYKVGQEDKIKIKWTNNNDQDMEFHAYDLNGNGKLDYVEWTVPHLSTQIFEIIFISKAFQLDANQEIVADIYEQVANKDGVRALIEDRNYVRVTFNKALTDNNDNTIYAEAVDPNVPVTIEVYPVYTDEDGFVTQGPLTAIFQNINNEGTYKVLLTELAEPTDVFLFKVFGNIHIDYIVDPHPTTITDNFDDTSKINLASITNVAVSGGVISLISSDTVPDAPTEVTATAGDKSATISFTAPYNGGSEITGYSVTTTYWYWHYDWLYSTSVTTIASSTNPIIVTGLNNGGDYTFSIAAINNLGTGSPSSHSNHINPIGVSVPNSLRIFVTSSKFSGNLGGLAGADLKCQIAAENGDLGGTWKAWLSDTTTSASSRLIHSSYSYVDLYNNIIANDWTGLTSGSLLYYINYNEYGLARDSISLAVRTNTTPSGGIISNQAISTCTNWTYSSNYDQFSYSGFTVRTDGSWTQATSFNTHQCPNTLPLYCVEQVSSVPSVPGAPTSVVATKGDTSASISFTAPANNGSTITSYTATSNPGGFTGTGTSSPVIVNGLMNGTPYTFTVTATNGIGTGPASSASNSVTPGWTCGQSSITDSRDSKSYSTVQIGTQCWLGQNMNIGTYVTANQTNNGVVEKYCYDNTESNCDVYGGMYSFNEAMQYVSTDGTQGICPTGWHVSTHSEWTTMINNLGGVDVAGKALKETGTTHWPDPNSATNSSGFTLLPTGGRWAANFFNQLLQTGYTWMTDTGSAWHSSVYYNSDGINMSSSDPSYGFGVRCVKN